MITHTHTTRFSLELLWSMFTVRLLLKGTRRRTHVSDRENQRAMGIAECLLFWLCRLIRYRNNRINSARADASGMLQCHMARLQENSSIRSRESIPVSTPTGSPVCSAPWHYKLCENLSSLSARLPPLLLLQDRPASLHLQLSLSLSLSLSLFLLLSPSLSLPPPPPPSLSPPLNLFLPLHSKEMECRTVNGPGWVSVNRQGETSAFAILSSRS